jgi:hypothetical protein
VSITVKNKIASGHIRTTNSSGETIIYRLYYIGNNIHRISRINQQFYKQDKSDNPISYFRNYNEQIQNRTETPCADPNNEIDVLVIYTLNAKNTAGGQTAIET